MIIDIPKTHRKIGSACAGHEGQPGDQYHLVSVRVSRGPRGDNRYRCIVVEHWGSNQGYLEEHDRTEVTGRGSSVREACEDARRRGREADIKPEYLVEGISDAESEAIDREADEAAPTYTTDGEIRGCCGHSHRTLGGALRCLREDQEGCRRQGGWSDREVMRKLPNGKLEPITDRDDDEVTP